ncbi:MAG: ClpXP protease specificity-enhancing factor, partial [Gammaproteobacteria bacterium]
IYLPMASIVAIYVRENGEGMVSESESFPDPDPGPMPDPSPSGGEGAGASGGGQSAKVSHLKRIK